MRGAARRLIRTLHLALGLGLGLWFMLLGATGALMVFWAEVDAALNPSLLRSPALARSQSQGIGLQAAWDSARRARPGTSFMRLLPPRTPDGVYILRWKTPQGERELCVDPVDGRVTGERLRTSTLLWQCLELHKNLLFQETGHRINGVLALGGSALLLSGMILWWPTAWRLLGKRLTVQPGTSPARLCFDLHNVLGIYSLPVLLLVTLTGVAFLYEHQTGALVSALWKSGEAKASAVSPALAPAPGLPATTPFLSLDRLAERAVSASGITGDMARGGKITSVELPGTSPEKRATLVFYGEPEGGRRWGDRIKILVDPATGTVLEVEDNREQALDKKIVRWLGPLHFGRWGGTFTKGIYVVVGLLVPLGLFLTGALRWWLGRKRI